MLENIALPTPGFSDAPITAMEEGDRNTRCVPSSAMLEIKTQKDSYKCICSDNVRLATTKMLELAEVVVYTLNYILGAINTAVKGIDPRRLFFKHELLKPYQVFKDVRNHNCRLPLYLDTPSWSPIYSTYNVGTFVGSFVNIYSQRVDVGGHLRSEQPYYFG